MAQQTTYSRSYSGALAGQVGDSGYNRKEAFLNAEGAAIPAGIAVQQHSTTEGSADEFDTNTHAIIGISVLSAAKSPGTPASPLSGEKVISDGAEFDVLTEGAIFVACEETVTVTDSVYARCTSDSGDNTQLGRFRNDSDSGKCRLVKGARFLTGGTTTSPALLYFSAAAERASLGDVTALTTDLSLTTSGHGASTIGIYDGAAKYTATNVETALAEVKLLADAAIPDTSVFRITLSAAAESANAIAVTGQVKNWHGTNVSSAKHVLVRTLAQTGDKGDFAVTTGTSEKEFEPSTGENVAWILTDATGAFVFTVTDSAAEGCIVQASGPDCTDAILFLDFSLV